MNTLQQERGTIERYWEDILYLGANKLTISVSIGRKCLVMSGSGVAVKLKRLFQPLLYC